MGNVQSQGGYLRLDLGRFSLLVLVSSENAKVHHDGNHQPGDAIHVGAAIGSSDTVTIHLDQTKASLGSEAISLGDFELAIDNECDSPANGDGQRDGE